MRKQLRIPQKGQPAASESLAATFNGNAISIDFLDGYSVVVAIVGTVAGTVKLQMSNNAFLDNVGDLTAAQIANPDAVWEDLPGSEYAVANTANFAWNIADPYYEAFRYVWTRTSGTGTLKAYIMAKGQY